MVHLWDARIEPNEEDERKPYLSLDHGAPVEAILFFPSGNVLVSAGGSTMKVENHPHAKILSHKC